MPIYPDKSSFRAIKNKLHEIQINWGVNGNFTFSLIFPSPPHILVIMRSDEDASFLGVRSISNERVGEGLCIGPRVMGGLRAIRTEINSHKIARFAVQKIFNHGLSVSCPLVEMRKLMVWTQSIHDLSHSYVWICMLFYMQFGPLKWMHFFLLNRL